jgi:TRAP-type mannitol/chloroaromatic compound transport system permease small subunit
MLRLAQFIDRCTLWLGRAVAWLTLVLVLVTTTVVVLRYAFDTGSIKLQESITYLYAAVFLLGAAYTLRQDGHVRVDIFYRRFSERGRAAVNLAGSVLALLPFGVFILWTSWDYAAASWGMRETSTDGGIPAVFLLKTLIPLLGVTLLFQGLSEALKNLCVLRGAALPSVDHRPPGDDL